MQIRTANDDDLALCAILYSEIFNAPPHDEDWTYSAALDRLREIKDGCAGSCFVAEQGNKVVGFAFCSYHTWWTGKVMRIDELGVDFRLQRHGIGTRLLEHCLAVGRQEGATAAEVLTPRTVAALEFYSSQSFQSAGRELLTRKL